VALLPKIIRDGSLCMLPAVHTQTDSEAWPLVFCDKPHDISQEWTLGKRELTKRDESEEKK